MKKQLTPLAVALMASIGIAATPAFADGSAGFSLSGNGFADYSDARGPVSTGYVFFGGGSAGAIRTGPRSRDLYETVADISGHGFSSIEKGGATSLNTFSSVTVIAGQKIYSVDAATSSNAFAYKGTATAGGSASGRAFRPGSVL